MIASVTERARVASPLDPAFTSETRRSLRAMTVPPCFDLLPGLERVRVMVRASGRIVYRGPSRLVARSVPARSRDAVAPYVCAAQPVRVPSTAFSDSTAVPAPAAFRAAAPPSSRAAAEAAPASSRAELAVMCLSEQHKRAITARRQGGTSNCGPVMLGAPLDLALHHILPHLRTSAALTSTPQASPVTTSATRNPEAPPSNGHSSSGSNIGFKASSGGRVSICASLLRIRLRNHACCFNSRGAFVRSRCHANEPISISRGS